MTDPRDIKEINSKSPDGMRSYVSHNPEHYFNTPTPATTQAINQSLPNVNRPPTREEEDERAEKLAQAKHASKAGSQDKDGGEDDEEREAEEQENQDDEEQAEENPDTDLNIFERAKKKDIQTYKKKLQKTRTKIKVGRMIPNITLPFSMGFVSGGKVLFAMIITSPIGILFLAMGGIGAFISNIMLKMFQPTKFVEKKTPPAKQLQSQSKLMRAISTKHKELYQSAMRNFFLESEDVKSEHNKKITAMQKQDAVEQNFYRAVFQPMGVFISIASGIMIVLIIIFAIAFAICDASIVGWVTDMC